MNTGIASLQLLVFAIFILLLMVMVKLVMILAFRQNVHFSRKFVKSFFYYNVDKIGRAQELRLKRYYQNSNKVNTIFYTAVVSLSALSMGIYVINTVGEILR